MQEDEPSSLKYILLHIHRSTKLPKQWKKSARLQFGDPLWRLIIEMITGENHALRGRYGNGGIERAKTPESFFSSGLSLLYDNDSAVDKRARTLLEVASGGASSLSPPFFFFQFYFIHIKIRDHKKEKRADGWYGSLSFPLSLF